MRVVWTSLVLLALLAPAAALAPDAGLGVPAVPSAAAEDPAVPTMPSSAPPVTPEAPIRPDVDPEAATDRLHREAERQGEAAEAAAVEAADKAVQQGGVVADEAQRLALQTLDDLVHMAGETVLRPAEREVHRLTSTLVFEEEQEGAGPDAQPMAGDVATPEADYTVPLLIATTAAAAAGAIAIWFAGSTGAIGTGAKTAAGSELRRVLPYASPLFTRFEKETVMGHPKREELYAAIVDEPGVPLHRLCTKTGLSRTAVLHHLRLLEHHHLVVSRRVGRSRHYFENGGRYGRDQKEAYAVLQNDRSRSVARFIRDHPGTIQKRMCDALGLQPSIAHWHVRRLQEASLVQPVRQGRTVSYYPSAELQTLA